MGSTLGDTARRCDHPGQNGLTACPCGLRGLSQAYHARARPPYARICQRSRERTGSRGQVRRPLWYRLPELSQPRFEHFRRAAESHGEFPTISADVRFVKPPRVGEALQLNELASPIFKPLEPSQEVFAFIRLFWPGRKAWSGQPIAVHWRASASLWPEH